MKQRLHRKRQAEASFHQTITASSSRPESLAKKDRQPAKHSGSISSALSATALTLTLIALHHLSTRHVNNTPLHTSSRPKSLLESYPTSNLPPCTAHRISLNDTYASSNSRHFPPPFDDKPTIYTDWQFDSTGLDTTTSFIERHGHIPQYVKMGDALPVFDKTGNLCVMPFRILISLLIRKFLPSTASNNDGLSPPKRETKQDLLIFTNQKESPQLFDTILNQYNTPDPLSFTKDYIIPPGEEYGWTNIFSVMMQRSSHRFHVHNEAWLGQVSGSRLWFLLPPTTIIRAEDVTYRQPACEYLYNREALPPNAMACVQNPGEVMYLPKNWWHATCGLEEWNVGVGEQLGAPTNKAPVMEESDGSRTEEEWMDKLEECLEGGAFLQGF